MRMLKWLWSLLSSCMTQNLKLMKMQMQLNLSNLLLDTNSRHHQCVSF